MEHTGELYAIFVAISWTATAMFAEVAVRRLGSLQANVVRLCVATILLSLTVWYQTGSMVPLYADSETWMWMILSGLVGFVFGDFCLFNCYQIIGSRFGQLFMTLAPVAAALSAWVTLGEVMSPMSIAGMTLTIGGIALSILTREESDQKKKRTRIKLPLKGVIYAIGAAVGQGVGIVLSKIGMNAYTASAPQEISDTIPVMATLMRSYAGVVGFVIMLAIMEGIGTIKRSVTDMKGMAYIFLGAIFGPFVGVTMSLMAVRLADAGVASTIMALSPVLILLPAHIFFKQKIKTIEVIGAIISVCGVALFFI